MPILKQISLKAGFKLQKVETNMYPKVVPKWLSKSASVKRRVRSQLSCECASIWGRKGASKSSLWRSRRRNCQKGLNSKESLQRFNCDQNKLLLYHLVLFECLNPCILSIFKNETCESIILFYQINQCISSPLQQLYHLITAPHN